MNNSLRVLIVAAAFGTVAPLAVQSAQRSPPAVQIEIPTQGSTPAAPAPAQQNPAPAPYAPPAQAAQPVPTSRSAPDSPQPLDVAPRPSQDDTPLAVGPVDTTPAPDGDTGTTIVGDQESPIGLFITPWKNEYAENGLDRPARFVDVDTGPIDPDVFQRRVEYYDVITAYRNEHISSGK